MYVEEDSLSRSAQFTIQSVDVAFEDSHLCIYLTVAKQENASPMQHQTTHLTIIINNYIINTHADKPSRSSNSHVMQYYSTLWADSSTTFTKDINNSHC